MAYEVEVTDEWLAWFEQLTVREYDEHLKILAEEGLI